jgi:4-amino-4-deoxychorismate lyase
MNMKIDKVSINGQIASAGKVSLLDAGFTYGLSVFETFRVSNKKVFLLDEHLSRLYSSLEHLKIKQPDKDELASSLNRLIDEFSSQDDLFIRLMVSAGPGNLTLSKQNYDSPNIFIYGAKIPKLTTMERPAKILTSVNRQMPEYYPLIKTRLKTNSYLNAHLAQTELDNFKLENKISGHVEGILLSPDGYVSEALTSNIFWTKNGQLYTPPLELGILPGIIRNYIVETKSVKEELISPDELITADEIFLTNSVNYLVPLNSINEHEKPGISGKFYKDQLQKISRIL